MGIQASILYGPARDITVIVLTNASHAGSGSHEIAQQLLASARTEEPSPLKPLKGES